ncbi:MAG: hypothetical protein RMY28_019130 [Nostoc sp. ChiSLP01]|nr:hypothetical protein [Nostoc sp. CmiSLP01]MDZ8287170.1 hypothetical protein [Nostoc sp. ChiSLP01]
MSIAIFGLLMRSLSYQASKAMALRTPSFNLRTPKLHFRTGLSDNQNRCQILVKI